MKGDVKGNQEKMQKNESENKPWIDLKKKRKGCGNVVVVVVLDSMDMT